MTAVRVLLHSAGHFTYISYHQLRELNGAKQEGEKNVAFDMMDPHVHLQDVVVSSSSSVIQI